MAFSNLLVMISLSIHPIYSVPSREILLEPNDITAKEGETVLLEFSLQVSTDFDNAYGVWSNGYMSYYESSDVIINTEQNFTTRTVKFILRLHQVKRNTGKYYTCSVTVWFLDGTHLEISSRLAELRVLYFLKQNEMVCRGPDQYVFRRGEMVHMECEAPRTSPEVTLKWTLCNGQDLQLSGERSFKMASGSQVIAADVLCARNLHDQAICCVASSSAYVGQSVNCSLGPFLILYPPLVDVLPADGVLMPPYTSQLAFHCRTDAFPKVSEYLWSCDPPYLFRSCDSLGDVLTLNYNANVSHQYNMSVIVTCKAKNILGNGKNKSHLRINFTPSKDYEKPSTYGPRQEMPLTSPVTTILYSDLRSPQHISKENAGTHFTETVDTRTTGVHEVPFILDEGVRKLVKVVASIIAGLIVLACLIIIVKSVRKLYNRYLVAARSSGREESITSSKWNSLSKGIDQEPIYSVPNEGTRYPGREPSRESLYYSARISHEYGRSVFTTLPGKHRESTGSSHTSAQSSVEDDNENGAKEINASFISTAHIYENCSNPSPEQIVQEPILSSNSITDEFDGEHITSACSSASENTVCHTYFCEEESAKG